MALYRSPEFCLSFLYILYTCRYQLRTEHAPIDPWDGDVFFFCPSHNFNKLEDLIQGKAIYCPKVINNKLGKGPLYNAQYHLSRL